MVNFMNGHEALTVLVEGNKRFIEGKSTHRNFNSRREELKSGQKPIATVVSCSDSRVVPEYIFDQGLGDIFTVISAGNVVDKIGLGSIENAVGHLHTPLLIVMGHEKCGAVAAAYDDFKESNITEIVNKIKPSVAKVKKGKDKPSECELLANENVKEVIHEIKKSPVVQEAVHKGLKIVGMKYHLDGKVEILQ